MDVLTSKVSIILPSRNEPYLKQTILDLLSKATGDIEIIAILDGYWPKTEDMVDDPRVIYVHFGEARGMRNGINSAAAIAKGEFLMKADAHCMFSKGFDEVLKANCEENWIVVPRRFALDPEKWEMEKRTDDKYPIDYEYIDFSDLHGVNWKEKSKERAGVMIDDIISAQGSCYFLRKGYFDKLGGLDEASYGTFFLEFQEISFKVWLSGGAVKVNKNATYCHWHKTKSRGYSLARGEREKAVEFLNKWMTNTAWDKQTLPFSSMIEKFMPMPTWPENWKELLNAEIQKRT